MRVGGGGGGGGVAPPCGGGGGSGGNRDVCLCLVPGNGAEAALRRRWVFLVVRRSLKNITSLSLFFIDKSNFTNYLKIILLLFLINYTKTRKHIQVKATFWYNHKLNIGRAYMLPGN